MIPTKRPVSLGLAAAAALMAWGAPAGADGRRVLLFDVPSLQARGQGAEGVGDTGRTEGAGEALGAAVIQALREVARGRPEVILIGPEEMETLIRLEGLPQAAGCAEEDCRRRIAAALEADWWVAGAIHETDGAWVATLRVTEVESGRVIATETVSGFDADGLAAAALGAAPRLLQLPPGAPAGTRPAFVLAAAEGEEPPSVAVLDLEGGDLSPEDRAGLSELVAVALRGVPGLSVISKGDIQRMLELETQRQLLGCEDDGCLAEIGGALGVQYLVAGDIARLGDTHSVSLKLIDIRTASIEHRVAESFTGEADQLFAAVRHAALRLVGRGLDERGVLRIESPVPELRVQLDGREVETAQLAAVPVGRHSLRLESDDHFPWLSDVYVRADQPVVVRAILEERPIPWYRTWWFWTVVGGIVVGAGTATGVVLATQPTTGTLQVEAAAP